MATKKTTTKKTAAKKTRPKRTATKTTTKKTAAKMAKKTAPKKTAAKKTAPKKRIDVGGAVDLLRARASADVRAGMGRFGIVDDSALGVSVKDIQLVAKAITRDHALAMALWQTGIYEARMLAAFVADPSALTVAEMNAWARDFDSWAVCDNACFHLFDKSSHAVGRVKTWAHVEDEFVRRAAFALLASLALHKNKAKASDDELKDLMPLVEVYAHDDRNFVKKALSWALRSCLRRPGLVDDARAIAATLSARSDRGARFIASEFARADRSRR